MYLGRYVEAVTPNRNPAKQPPLMSPSPLRYFVQHSGLGESTPCCLTQGIAFIIVEVQDFCDNSAETQLLERIEQFVRIHRNSFLLLAAALYGPKEWEILLKIQQRFLGSNLRIIPTHNAGDMVNSMLTIAKVTCKPHVDSIRDRIAMIRAQIIERSPVWEMFHKRQLNDA
ncbi:protein SPO16 homolog [Mustelus asterias]